MLRERRCTYSAFSLSSDLDVANQSQKNMSAAAAEHPPMIYRRLGRTGLKASSLREDPMERRRR